MFANKTVQPFSVVQHIIVYIFFLSSLDLCSRGGSPSLCAYFTRTTLFTKDPTLAVVAVVLKKYTTELTIRMRHIHIILVVKEKKKYDFYPFSSLFFLAKHLCKQSTYIHTSCIVFCIVCWFHKKKTTQMKWTIVEEDQEYRHTITQRHHYG